ncbi:MAG: hydroxymethylglutaryl-CoA synthase family protein [Candidatus Helarchaeota archaeon]
MIKAGSPDNTKRREKKALEIGISAMGFYFPRYYISLEELLRARNEDPNKAKKGLGVQQMAILANNEDSVTMAANAIEALNYPKNKVGKLIFATECGVDSAKDCASYVHELCQLPSDCEAYDIKAACAASSYGLWQIIDWIRSGRGRGKDGIVVCSDKAVYDYKSSAEVTGGGGAIALLVTENPEIINFNQEVGYYKKNMRDFWKPLGSECAVVAGNGKFSIESYLEALSCSFQNYLLNGGSKDFDFFIFHTPYAKMVYKAFNTLSTILPEIEERFESMTAPSLKIPSLVGNVYNGALYLALASLLETYGETVREKSIGFYAFGSGCSSKFFRGVVAPTFNSKFNLIDLLNNRIKLTPAQYEQYRQGELVLEEKRGFLMEKIDNEGYRHYISK